MANSQPQKIMLFLALLATTIKPNKTTLNDMEYLSQHTLAQYAYYMAINSIKSHKHKIPKEGVIIASHLISSFQDDANQIISDLDKYINKSPFKTIEMEKLSSDIGMFRFAYALVLRKDLVNTLKGDLSYLNIKNFENAIYTLGIPAKFFNFEKHR